MQQNRQQTELLPQSNRFNRSNPPSDIRKAKARLDELDGSIAHIETQLEHLDIDDFHTDKDYDAWKTRAIAALSYIKAEQVFLEKWLGWKQNSLIAPKASKAAVQAERLAAADKATTEISERVVALAKSIRTEYQPKYTLRCLPETVDVATARLTLLTVLYAKLQGHFSQINSEWARHASCGHIKLSGVKAPLQSILTDIQAEMAVVRSVIKS